MLLSWQGHNLPCWLWFPANAHSIRPLAVFVIQIFPDFSSPKKNEPEHHSPSVFFIASFSPISSKKLRTSENSDFKIPASTSVPPRPQLRRNPPAFRNQQCRNQIRAHQIVLSRRMDRQFRHVLAHDSQFPVNPVFTGIGARNPNRFGIKIKGVNRRITQPRRRNRQNS